MKWIALSAETKDEAETLKLFPGGVAAMGFGRLALSGDRLRIKAKWNPAAYYFGVHGIFCLIFRYLSIIL